MDKIESTVFDVLRQIESETSASQPPAFDAAMVDEAGKILAKAIGPDHAVTLDRLKTLLGLPSRRQAEQLVESALGKFPFLLVAGSCGYWRPTSAEQINSYLRSLHRRHKAMQIREKTVIRKSLLEAWPRENGWFVDPSNMQPMLLA